MKAKSENYKRTQRNSIFGKRIYYTKGTELFEAWNKTYKEGKQFYIELEIKGSNEIYYRDYFYCFEYKCNIYAEVGVNHLNTYLNNLNNYNNFHLNLVNGVYLRKVLNGYLYNNYVKKHY